MWLCQRNSVSEMNRETVVHDIARRCCAGNFFSLSESNNMLMGNRELISWINILSFRFRSHRHHRLESNDDVLQCVFISIQCCVLMRMAYQSNSPIPNLHSPSEWNMLHKNVNFSNTFFDGSEAATDVHTGKIESKNDAMLRETSIFWYAERLC